MCLEYKGKCCRGFSSYLSARRQTVVVESKASGSYLLQRDVPQGSVLGPRLFSIYTQPFGRIVSSHGFRYHLYAKNIQLYLSLKLDVPTDGVKAPITACLAHISDWMLNSRLVLNNEKTDLVVFLPNQKTSSHNNFAH